MSSNITLNNYTDDGEDIDEFIINRYVPNSANSATSTNACETTDDADNICSVCYEENVDVKAICKGCKKNICSNCFAGCLKLNLKLDDKADKGIRIIYKCVFCRYYNPMKEEQPCDVYRYLIKKLHINEHKYIRLFNELLVERRDEEIERDELRKELDRYKTNLNKLDKYCRETHNKTIRKEKIISIIDAYKN